MNNEVSLSVYYNIDLRSFDIRATTDATIAEFKVMVALYFDVPVDQQRLFHINGELRNDQTIESYGLQDGHVVYLIRGSIPTTFLGSTSVGVAVADAAALGGNGIPDISIVGSVQNLGFGGSSNGTVPGILINIQYLSETRFAIRARLELTVGEFKGQLAQLQNIPVTEQRLIYNGQFLQDDKTIGSYGLQEGHVIHLARRTVPATTLSSPSAFDPSPIGENNTEQSVFGNVMGHPYMGVNFLSNNGSFPEGFNMLGQRYDDVHVPFPNILPPVPWGGNAGTNIPFAGWGFSQLSWLDAHYYQLSQLQAMGFTNNHANMLALITTSDNIQEAVALLRQLGDWTVFFVRRSM